MDELEEFLNKKYRFLNLLLVKDFYEIEAEIESIERKRLIVQETLSGLKEVLLFGRDVQFVSKKLNDDDNVFGELKVVSLLNFKFKLVI